VRNRLSCGIVFVLVSLASASSSRAADLRAYGEYLSGDCVSCHRRNATHSPIPALESLGAARIVEALRAFKSGQRTNQVMVSVARGLNEEQISALAAYFAAAKRPTTCRTAC
jgi:cytochrome c